jgi:hypothetical protein
MPTLITHTVNTLTTKTVPKVVFTTLFLQTLNYNETIFIMFKTYKIVVKNHI